ncbi:BspA family leucine-rich repeat surface protein [Terrimonas rubra]|uniref:BspA family leucine-rich repeat surface protein n=1 Tax=Terrimonas rubra TaxID=1035890 RepID=A0ABW6A101_9BACT
MKKTSFGLLFLLASLLSFSQTPFITTWNTTKDGVSANNQVVFPGPAVYSINWELLSNPAIAGTAAGAFNTTINFPAPGIYRIKVLPVAPTTLMDFNMPLVFNTGDAQKLLSIEQWGSTPWAADMSNAFGFCANMNITATDIPGFSGVTSMNRMFFECVALTANTTMNNWNTAAVTDFGNMFHNAVAFNQVIGNWSTGNAVFMDSMFLNAATFNQPIGGWNTTKVTHMNSMFEQAFEFNQPLNNWTTAQVSTMANMFEYAFAFNQPLSQWNTGNVTSMRSMFELAFTFNQPLGSWNLQKISAGNGSLETMFDGSGLNCINYDATLAGWAAMATTPNNLNLGSAGIIYSAATGVTARNNLLTNKGWQITGDSYNAGCSATLPVSFGHISAIIRDNRLLVNWTTLTENNNDHFEIELSANGKDFFPYATVQTLAKEGNSSTPLSYSHNLTVPQKIGLGLMLLLLMPLSIGSRKIRRMALFLLLFAGTRTMYSCSKNNADMVLPADKIYVRIKQVDKDRHFIYSNVVKAGYQ